MCFEYCGVVMEISFGYSHYLKTYWYQGKLPTVKRGIYGGELKKVGPNQTTLEHLLPYSKGGKTTIDNLALATRENNNNRDCAPLQGDKITSDIVTYLRQFKNVVYGKLDGNRYISLIINTLDGQGIHIDRKVV